MLATGLLLLLPLPLLLLGPRPAPCGVHGPAGPAQLSASQRGSVPVAYALRGPADPIVAACAPPRLASPRPARM